MWGMGDYPAVGDRFAIAAEGLVAELVDQRHRVLDVGCGQAPGALAAARLGAQVTGLDNSAELLAVARGRAEAEGLEVRWLLEDMTAMSAPDHSFDRVISSFGAMFAADAPAMAAEMVRVCAPGGVVANLAWAPDGAFAQLQPVLAKYLQGGAGPDIHRWAMPDQVAAIFVGLPVDVQTRVDTVRVRWESIDHATTEITTKVPGVLMARRGIEPSGRWPDAVQDIHTMLAGHGQTGDEGFLVSVPYLTTLAKHR